MSTHISVEMTPIALTFDVEEDYSQGTYIGVTTGIPVLLNLLNKFNVKGTFFIVADICAKYPYVIERILKEGHEVGCHGLYHERLDELDIKEKNRILTLATSTMERSCGVRPKSFRAPEHSIDIEALKILNNLGYVCDSSVLPALTWPLKNIVRKPGFLIAPRGAYHPSSSNCCRRGSMGIMEIPCSSLFLIPFTSLIPRYLGSKFFKIFFIIMLSMAKLLGRPIVFLAHSWDLIELERISLSYLNAGAYFIRILHDLLSLAKRYDLEFVTLSNLVQLYRNH